MDPKEQEKAIGELEERVDRLRTLYEQYFLGFEKLMPEVPRKDVERRFAMLRKEQIRNTAVRYRFNVVTQKFNTYAMYWQRICRQIEEGTFKRHLAKAKKILGEREMKHLSIDVDLTDFDDEDFDMDAVLREANESAEAFANETPDTVPPPPSDGASRRPLAGTPGASFKLGGGREVVDDVFPPERESQPGLMRSARPAVLPTGSKPRVLRKIGGPGSSPRPGSEPPESRPSNPGTSPGTNPGTNPGRPRVAVPAAPQSSPRIPAPSPPQSSPRVAVPTAPQSSPRVAVPAPPGARPPAPSAGRMPVANPPMPGARQPAQSAGRMPVANPPMPSGNRIPAANPPVRPPATSTPRIALPKPPPSAGKLPAADEEEKAATKSRQPLPLPSQHARPKKPE